MVTPPGTDVGHAGGGATALATLVATHVARTEGWNGERAPIGVLDAEVLAPGRPGIVDVVASVGARELHLPIGLRSPGHEARFLAGDDDPVLGVLEDDEGPAVAFDALRDAEVLTELLRRVAALEADPGRVRQVRGAPESVTTVFEDRLTFTVFTEVIEGPRPGLVLLLALDRVGFNHIAAPLAVWRRAGRDLGIVQEHLAGASSGWALAVTSVRDLYASGGPPELAGGDFGSEAHRLGTMTARMHLGLDQAFGRRPGQAAAWADAIDDAVRSLSPTVAERPDVVTLLEELRALASPCWAIRTHGDFDLGRVARTEQGWYVVDFASGGQPSTVGGTVPGAGEPVYRSPLADVADLLWSLGEVARTAAAERDPTGREGLGELADAWERRNRRAFFAGYLGVPGISGLVPAGRSAISALVDSFALERSAVSARRVRR